jgi:protein-S-isoprenylcysteine O-methyltransferase Ste14
VVNASDSVEPATQQQPTPTVQLGRLKLTGVWAVLALLVLLALLIVLLIYARPRVSVLISAGLWLAMDIYWSIAELKRPQAKSAESTESRRRHGLLTSTALLLIFLPIPGLTGQFVPDTLTTALVGLGLQIGFTLFYLFARFYLGRLWSGAIRIMEDHELIQTGPYRFLRHPMYTGMLGMFAGTAIVSGQYHALLGVAVGALAYVRKIRIEDRVLSAEFGPVYEAYRKRTAALIPWVL